MEREDGSFAPAHVLADGRLERAGRAMRPELQRRSSHASGHHHTAGVVVIGDEILAAKVDDENTAFLCAQLHAIGWRVRKVRPHPGSFLPPAPPRSHCTSFTFLGTSNHP